MKNSVKCMNFPQHYATGCGSGVEMRNSILKHFSLHVCLITALGALPGTALAQFTWQQPRMLAAVPWCITTVRQARSSTRYLALDSGNGTRLVVDGEAQPASNFGDPSSAIYAKYSLSPDGKHVAHFAFPLQPTGNAEHGLFLDGKYTPINYGMNTKFLTFSPDCKHLAWFQAVPSTLQFRIVIHGKPVAQTEALSTLGINNDAIKWFEFLPDGTLLVLGQDDNSLKRFAITPSSETSLATIGDGSAVAANH